MHKTLINSLQSYIPILLIFTFIGCYINFINDNRENDLKKNGFLTIGKVDDFFSNRSSNRLYYYFYIENRKQKASQLIKINGENLIGQYYKVYVSKKDLKNSFIEIDQKIIDTNLIKKAGF